MKKRLTAILMALMIMVTLLPMPAMAVTNIQEAEIQAAVSAVIQDYAAKVYRPNADDDAFNDFFHHGFFGKGKRMTLTEQDAFVSSVFNACVMQEALTRSITAAIVSMKELNQRSFYLSGGPGWHNYYYTFQFNGYRGDEKKSSNFLGQIVTARTVYGTAYYQGPTNENDTVMELLVGTMDCDIIIRQTDVTAETTGYSLELQISDEFNFNGDYSHIAEKGYDTSTDDTLNNLGYLITFFGLDEFEWSYDVSFQVEVPTNCDHIYNRNYHWTLNTGSHTLIADGENGFTANYANPIAVTDSETDEVTYQYKLEEPVVLRHNKPWVMEYDLQPVKSLSLSPLPASSTCYPYFLQHSTTHVWVPYYEKHGVENEKEAYRWHYNGVEILKKFPYSSNRVFSFRVENILDNDGGNMPWVTIYDDTGNVVFGPEPLNDYWTSSSADTTRVLTESDTTRLSGQDIIIRYIGSTSNRIVHDKMDLRIWENGKEPAEDVGTYIAPTCTEQGGVRRHCIDCGCDYIAESEPALGHLYTDYVDDENGSCTEGGTKTRSCTRCGITETVAVEGGAVGHAFGEFVSDNNTTCTDVGTETRTCARCGLTETRTLEGSAIGHDFGAYSFDHNSSCTEDGTMTAVCKNCGEKDTVSAEGSATGHRYEATVTEPTCTEQGYTTYTCSCGDSYVGDYTAPAEHAWDEGVVTVQPTLTTPGTVKYTCTLCGESKHMSTEVVENTGFEDVPADAYYADAVVWAKGAGVTSGLSETLFGSDMSCTRGQVVTFLWAAAGKPEPTKNENPFTDVSEADYYYKPVLWAVEQGITGGIGEGLFGPDQSCTRGQIVTFLWRAKNSPETSGSNSFTDVAETDYYFKSVLWASENAITGGIGEGLFGPNNTCTRAQVVTFLYKTYR